MLDTFTVRVSFKKFTPLMENPQIIGNKGFIEEGKQIQDQKAEA